MIRAKKSLGQHFLKDKNTAAEIVESLSANAERILEVGPGTGALTDFLLARPNVAFKAIEVDKEFVRRILEKYPDFEPNLIRGDFLKSDLSDLFDGKNFAVIGNFPYNISSQIFFKVIENRNLIPEVVGMVQKEVAERMAAAHGNKTYGILSVLLQRWYDVEYLFTVHENVFLPPPKVKSAVVRLVRNARNKSDCDEKLFVKTVKTTFNQRRKTIRNSLKPILGDKRFEHEFLTLRPEQLSVDDFVKLVSALEKISTVD